MGLWPPFWGPRAEEKGPHLSRRPREPILLRGWPAVEPPLFQLCSAFLGLESGGFLKADLVTCGRRPMNECLLWSSNFHFEELPPFPYRQSGCDNAHIMGVLGGSAEMTHTQSSGAGLAHSQPQQWELFLVVAVMLLSRGKSRAIYLKGSASQNCSR